MRNLKKITKIRSLKRLKSGVNNSVSSASKPTQSLLVGLVPIRRAAKALTLNTAEIVPRLYLCYADSLAR